MGIVPANALARSYRDVLGRVNAIWAERRRRGAASPSRAACCAWSGHERACSSARSRAIAEPDAAAGRGGAGAARPEDEAARLARRARAPGGAHRGIQRTATPSLGTPVVVVVRRRPRRRGRGRERLPARRSRRRWSPTTPPAARPISVLARHAGARLVVVDCGVAEPLPVARRARPPARAPARRACCAGPAMTREQAIAALETGIALAGGASSAVRAASRSARWASATPRRRRRSAARSPARRPSRPAAAAPVSTTRALARKRDVVAPRAARVNAPDARATPSACWRPWAGSSSACSRASRSARRRAASRSCSTATRPRPACSSPPRSRRSLPASLIAAHRSAEPGHAIVLAQLGLQPLLDLELRLGEGSGAALALPLLGAALAILDEMATFASAGVDDSGR